MSAGKLKGNQNWRIRALLNMMYKPAEIANEVGFDRRMFKRVYFPLGCPFATDRDGSIYVNGVAFHDWYFSHYTKRKLQANEAFCRTCDKGVQLVNPVEKEAQRNRYLAGHCPNCNRKISRIVARLFNES